MLVREIEDTKTHVRVSNLAMRLSAGGRCEARQCGLERTIRALEHRRQHRRSPLACRIAGPGLNRAQSMRRASGRRKCSENRYANGRGR
jgi:hypothetical protein